MTILETENLTHYYENGMAGAVAAIENINVKFEKGEIVGIIGHTGSGKSTLLQHLNGLLKPDSGRVLLCGEDINKDKRTLRAARFRVGLCFQYPEYQLFEETVYKDISFGPKNMGLDSAEIDRRVRRAAEFVGLSEEHLKKSPFDLSGGEKRRAAIAGVMAMEPEVLILDEPTAGLDPRGREVILSLVRTYRDQTGSTVILVSHSMEDVAKTADKVLVLNHSHVAMFGTVPEVYSRTDELEEMGLTVPQITKIFRALHDRGFDVSPSVFTVSQGADELMRYFEGRGLIFCVMSIGGLEYPMMIAVIIGITNMIPYVGPWMGTIPCALILLMVNPGHAIAFVIIVIIAQQIDSNLIYPRVVGTSVGLPAIWVLFAITVGGGLFGVLGMIVGVPVMSIIYTVMREKTASGTPNQPSQPEKKKHRWHIRQSVQTLYSRAAKRKNSENDHSDSAK